MLVKALPNPSKTYGETVCCAGVTEQGKWKRLYPVRFRHLQTKFSRWDWVEFRYRAPTTDTRRESCHVFEDTLKVPGKLKDDSEKAAFLNPLVLPSTAAAAAQGMSLALIRPTRLRFIARRKTAEAIAAEREGYKRAANQPSFLDKDLEALVPPPLAFYFTFEDQAGSHTYRCGDWETNTTFWKWAPKYGEEGTLRRLSERYNDEYPSKGVVFAMGTVKARPKQWLLLGVIRLNELTDVQMRQGSFSL